MFTTYHYRFPIMLISTCSLCACDHDIVMSHAQTLACTHLKEGVVTFERILGCADSVCSDFNQNARIRKVM